MKSIRKCSRMIISVAPFYVLLNLLALVIVSIAQVGSGYAMGQITAAILEADGIFNGKVVFPILLFALAITIGGNPENFKNMLVTLYTKRAQKLFSKMFMLRTFEEKQDRYYDSKYLEEYIFVRDNIEGATRVAATLFNKMAGSVIAIFLTGFAILRISPLILVFILLQTVLILVVNNLVVKKEMAINRKYVEDERKAEYYREVLSTKAHAKEIRILGLQSFFRDKWENVFRVFAGAKYRFERKAVLVTEIPTAVRHICLSGLTIYYLFLVSQGHMSLSNFVFINTVMWLMVGNINNLVYLIGHDLREDMLYIDRYFKFIGDEKKYMGRVCRAENEEPKTHVETALPREIELRNIRYAYPNQEKQAVKGANLKIRSGEIVCLVGFNGSGKSTLSKVMCGILEDYTGEVLLDGKDIKELDKEEYSALFGVGFQDFTRFCVSLYENVGIGCMEKMEDKEEVGKALEKGNLSGMIAKLEKGELTILGKEYDANGQELSGGQWQRVALARAYMGEPWLVILDEPTAAIDPLEELRLLENFRAVIGDRAALLISHRIGFARLADRICVMQDGRVIEEGSHKELLEKHGVYHEMFEAQKELYEEGRV